MTSRHALGVRAWATVAAVLVILSAGAGPAAQTAPAAPIERLETSANWVPDAAAAYSCVLRLGELVEAVGKSRAWAEIRSLPAVQEVLGKLQSDPNAAKIEAVRKNPEVKRALELLGDMFSQEVFVYAGPDSVDAIDLVQKVSTAANYGPGLAHLTGEAGKASENALRARFALRTLAENLDQLKVPNLLVGFKLKNRDRGVEAIGKIEALLGVLAAAAPQVGERIKRKPIAGQEYLTIELDGGMVPWDEVRELLEKTEVSKADVEKVLAKLKKTTLAIALGMRENYLLLLVGPSTELLGRLGKGKGLAGSDVLKPLEKFADRRVLGFDYISPAMSARVFDNTRQLKDLAAVLRQSLPAAKLSDRQKDQIRKDLEELLRDVGQLSPKYGAVTSVDFLSDRGIESYTFSRGERFELDASKPLGLLRHVGGRPILAVVARSPLSPGEYELVVKWIKIAIRYFDEYGLPHMKADDREMYKKVVERLRPLAKRADELNRATLLPALADGQVGLVLDAKLTSRQFHKDLPATERPMPMLEPAILLGVTSAAQLRRGCDEYRKLLNELIRAVRELAPDANIPEFQLPEPKTVKTAAGTISVYALPEEWGLDKQIALSFGVSEHVAAAGISRKQVERLLAATPLRFGGLLADSSRPLGMAVGYDGPALVETATPWIELAVRHFVKEDTEGVLKQVRTVLAVLKTVRGITAESTVEDGVLVTHVLVEVRDLDHGRK